MQTLPLWMYTDRSCGRTRLSQCTCCLSHFNACLDQCTSRGMHMTQSTVVSRPIEILPIYGTGWGEKDNSDSSSRLNDNVYSLGSSAGCWIGAILFLGPGFCDQWMDGAIPGMLLSSFRKLASGPSFCGVLPTDSFAVWYLSDALSNFLRLHRLPAMLRWWGK